MDKAVARSVGSDLPASAATREPVRLFLGSVDHGVKNIFDNVRAFQRVHAGSAAPKFANRLWAAQQQLCENHQLICVHVQRFARDVTELVHATAAEHDLAHDVFLT